MIPRSLLVPALLTLAFTAAAPRAEACSIEAGVYTTFPAEGEATWPANAPLYFYGVDLSLGDAADPFLTATVDGQPAALVDASAEVPHVPLGNSLGDTETSLRIRLDPPPSPGQAVSITGTLCPAGEGCPEVNLQFTVGEPDTAEPHPGPRLWFDLHDHPDDAVSTDCSALGPFTYHFRLEGGAAQAAGEAPLAIRINAYSSGSPGTQVASWTRLVKPAGGGYEIRGSAGLVAADLPAAYCFEAQLIDLAGNVGAVSNLTCSPCRHRESSAPDARIEEPMWTEGDRHAGGLCADGQNPLPDASDDEDVGGGGSCRFAAAPRAPWRGLLLAALPALLVLRRRNSRHAARRGR